MRPWRLWERGAEQQRVALTEDLTPRVDSWNARSDPDRVRLQTYLDRLQARLHPLPPDETTRFLHLVIDGEAQRRLTDKCDLDNHLLPVVQRLGPQHFTLVSAIRCVGGGSHLSIGVAVPKSKPLNTESWGHFQHEAGSAAASKAWMVGLWDALHATEPIPLAPGPAEVCLAWRCSLGREGSRLRNWARLWKPTIDAMGPVLGWPAAQDPRHARRFRPDDGRIVSLELHLDEEASMGSEIAVGMWWRAIQ